MRRQLQRVPQAGRRRTAWVGTSVIGGVSLLVTLAVTAAPAASAARDPGPGRRQRSEPQLGGKR